MLGSSTKLVLRAEQVLAESEGGGKKRVGKGDSGEK
jgi:hypothetical protein